MKILLLLLTLTAYSTAWAECVSGNCENGTGTLVSTLLGGSKYVGEWRDGKRHGKGTLTFASGTIYVGEWRDGNFHGEGTWTGYGVKYVGEFVDGNHHGKGTVTWANGDEYVGEWRDHKQHGEGTETYADGTVKAGVWQNGEYFGTKAEWDAKEKHDRIYRACLLDKGANLDMQVYELKQAVVETCSAVAADPSWLDQWRYD